MKILIQAAFSHELKAFIDSINPIEVQTIAHRKCFVTQVNQHKIYITYCGIGNTAAACTTTALCEVLNPDYILLCGTAGGLLPEQKTGDIVIANKIIDIDLHDLPTIIFDTPFQDCLIDFHLNKTHTFEFQPNKNLLNLATLNSPSHVSQGAIVTTNIFPAPKDFFQKILSLNCSAIEMESGGVFTAAEYYAIPVMTIRAISNSLDKNGNDLGTPPDAIAICSQRLADFLFDFLPRIN